MKTFSTAASGFSIALVLACLAGVPDNADANTLTVTNLNDSGAGTLRQLVHDSAANDTIVFAVSGTITLTNGELMIGTNLTITGPDPAGLTVSGNNASRVFNIAAGITANLSNLIIRSGNSQDNGGGIYNNGTLTINNCTLSSNVTITNGGGIFNDNYSSLTINNSTVSDNRAFHSGGGIGYYNSYHYDKPMTNICNNCTFSDNIANDYGGGIYSEGYSPLTMNNCTVAGNIAGTGGGIFDVDNGGDLDFASLTLINCTISQNTANSEGGGLYVLREGDESHDEVIIFNTIIAKNYDYDYGYGTEDVDSASFPIISLGHNFIGQAFASAGWVDSDQADYDPTLNNPGLGPLQDNGGPTFTMAPSYTFLSPMASVIDAGDDAVLSTPYNLTTDQRGRPRQLHGNPYPLGTHVDIGAVEIGPVTLVVTNNNDSGAGSLRQAILDAFLYEDDTITFAPNVTGIITLSSGELLLNKSINITGPGATNLAISANGASRVFDITDVTVNISGVTIRDGLVAGGIVGSQQSGRDNQGAGVLNYGVLGLTGCEILNNSVTGGKGGSSGGQGGDGEGAGIANFNRLSLNNSYVHDNTANGGNGGNSGGGLPGSGGNGWGGGIYNVSNLVVIASTISSNTANFGRHGTGTGGEGFNGSGFGGGVASISGVVSNNTSTIANNMVKGVGGGVYYSSAIYSAVSCTISANIANPDGNGSGGNGGGIDGVSSIGTLADTIVAGNIAVTSPDTAGAFATSGYNFIGIAGGGFINGNNHDQIGTLDSALDPALGPLADNGGPTPTMALLPGSPAIDQGNSFGLAADQRGRLRRYDFAGITNVTGGDGSDIGAYEVNASSVVTNTADDGPGSLRQVLFTSIPAEVITFAPGVTGTITLTTGELLINKYLTIAGPTDASVTVSGNHSSRVFHFNVGSYADSMRISNLTIANGNTTGPGAGIFNETGTAILLNNCAITGNTSGDSGGGIANNGLITLTNCTVSGNQAVAGGGLYNYCGTLNLWCCTVASNSAAIGGGFYDYPTVCSYAEISGTLIADNSATGTGPDVVGLFTSSGYNLIGKTNGLTGSLGGINQLGSIGSPLDPKIGPLQNNGGPTFSHALLADSPALNTGSRFGLTADQRGSLRPLCSAIVIGGDGSDIGAYESQFCPTNLLVANLNDGGAGSLRQAIARVEPGGSINFASDVTGVVALTTGELLLGKSLTIIGPTNAGLTVSGNNTNRVFHLTGGTVSLSSLTIANGSAGGPGGGFFSETGSTLILNNCTVSSNVTANSGGGIANNGTVLATNCTFSGNHAVAGGGIYTYAGPVVLRNCTVCFNSSGSDGGGLFDYGIAGSLFTIGSTLVASNTAVATGPDVISSPTDSFISMGYNLIGKGNLGFGLIDGVNQDQIGTIASPLDPKIGPLQNNGGPTFTHALLAGSPAIDQGSSTGIATDQRGRLRPYDFAGIGNATGGDGSDIGSFELTLPVLSLARSANNVIVSWSASDTGYTLQAKTNLNPSVIWATVSPAPIIVNGQNAVTNPLSGPQKFYRLSQ